MEPGSRSNVILQCLTTKMFTRVASMCNQFLSHLGRISVKRSTHETVILKMCQKKCKEQLKMV